MHVKYGPYLQLLCIENYAGLPHLLWFSYFWAKRIPMPVKKTNSSRLSTSFSASTAPRAFTGRLLVRLDPRVGIATIVRVAKSKGLRLASMQDEPTEGFFGRILQQHDGVIFGKLRVALINEAGAGRLAELQAASNSPFLSGEPERYIRALGGPAGGSGRSKGWGGAFRDTAAATWGVQAVNAMGVKHTGKGVKLAILDTGFDFTHPDFSGRSIHRKSFVGTRQARDKEGHGTHIAGIAGGDRRGRDGVRYGIASGARLYIGKILDDSGEGTDGQTLAGIEWALEKGCQVISMSCGATVGEEDGWSEVFEQVARIAMANQCLLIAAAGNESHRSGKRRKIAAVNHPANCPGIMAVGALTPELKIAEYSCAGVSRGMPVSGSTGASGGAGASGGPGRSGGEGASGSTGRSGGAGASGGMGASGSTGASGGRFGQVDIAAPGDNILSAKKGGGYRRESGTSMATAFVAGVAALVWEQYPLESAGEIWARLVQQAWRLVLPASDAGAGLCAMRN